MLHLCIYHSSTCRRERVAYVCLDSVCHGSAGGSSRVGYIRLATFNSNTTAAAKDAISALDKAGVDAMVLDIRNNGGGLFPAGNKHRAQCLVINSTQDCQVVLP